MELKNIYYNPEAIGSFGGVNAFKRGLKLKNIKVENKELSNWLKGQEPYTRYKPRRKKFLRRSIITFREGQVWEADLIDMSNISRYNENYKFLLAVIDDFTKYVFCRTLKTKAGVEIANAFRSIIEESQHPPNYLRTDFGGEFISNHVKNVCKEYGIHIYYCYNTEVKCAIIERWIRSFRTRLARYFEYSRSYRYIDVLKAFIQSYNNSYHRSIQMSPAQAQQANPSQLFKVLHKRDSFRFDPTTLRSNGIGVGDFVRITRIEQVFEKGFYPKWTKEVFKVREIIPHPEFFSFKLEDLSGTELAGSFNIFEIQKVNPPDENTLYTIEKILARKTVRGTPFALVKWEGFPNQFNQWIPVTDIQQIT
jgi:hypothetical protein